MAAPLASEEEGGRAVAVGVAGPELQNVVIVTRLSSLFFSCFFFSLSPMIRAFPPVASFRVSSPNTRKRDSSSRNDLPVMLQTPVFSLRMKSSA